MPKYVFDCQTDGCGVRFERTLKMGSWPTHECPSCHEDAPRVFDKTDFGFGFVTPEGATPGNTGVHKEDYPTADHAVGRSAEARWETIEARNKLKDQARAQGGTHALVRQDGDGYIDYAPLTPLALEGRKKLGQSALAAIRAQKESKGADR